MLSGSRMLVLEEEGRGQIRIRSEVAFEHGKSPNMLWELDTTGALWVSFVAFIMVWGCRQSTFGCLRYSDGVGKDCDTWSFVLLVMNTPNIPQSITS